MSALGIELRSLMFVANCLNLLSLLTGPWGCDLEEELRILGAESARMEAMDPFDPMGGQQLSHAWPLLSLSLSLFPVYQEIKKSLFHSVPATMIACPSGHGVPLTPGTKMNLCLGCFSWVTRIRKQIEQVVLAFCVTFPADR